MPSNTIPNRDRWFMAKDKFVLKDKELLIYYHFNMALNKTLTIFEYDGLPETIPYRELEKIIQLNGFGYWLKKEDKLYVFFGGLGGRPNEYYEPTDFIVANPYLQFYKTVEVDKNGVLMWNDYAHMGLSLMLIRYAELMAECDMTLRFGLINARVLSILYSNNDTVKESAKAFLEDVEKGEKLGVIMGQEWRDDNGDFNVSDYRKANSSDLKSVMELQQYLKASFWNEIGIQANYNMKRESINDSEAGMNEESLKPFIDNMLQCRQEALEKVNKMYGTNITVRLNSSWIRRNEIPNDETKENTKEETKVVEETKTEKEKETEENV